MECENCGYSSNDENDFEEELCLGCCRVHEIDY